MTDKTKLVGQWWMWVIIYIACIGIVGTLMVEAF